MSDLHFPVRPDLEQLKHQAKDLLREIRSGDPGALAALAKHHPEQPQPAQAKLADAQLVLARLYGIASWPRLVLGSRMTEAIWTDDVETVRDLVTKHPNLVHEDARGLAASNWGLPMTYAANIGRDRIIALLRDRGAVDLQRAFDRACLQGQLDTARRLYTMGARPEPNAVMGPCETLSHTGLAFLLELGVELQDAAGDRLAPVGLILQTYSRDPERKHRCLELIATRSREFPDTPPMAVHRGRIDLLEQHLQRDPGLLARAFTHREIFPPELGCHADESLALHGTPVAGGTLLHLCADYEEVETARWLLAHGADVNAQAAIDADGFGGHTPLFGCVVSQTYRTSLRTDDGFARLFLDHGADPNARASVRKRLRFVKDESMHEYPDVTPVGWGERFHDRDWVNAAAMRLIVERGGHA